ncbi:MAG: c-type cytochrome [Rubrivivax sp.]|nr:MAG: c-type cytochrome [Rubrivivax sp.]
MRRIALGCCATAVLLAACQREKREFDPPPPPSVSAAASTKLVQQSYEENAYAVSQGKRLFRWYNCAGCHGNGGGNMGPPLMDDEWLYGSEPAQIATTILEGRPKGMPGFKGRIPLDQVWQITAYVRSASGQLRSDVAPSRSDSVNNGKPEQRREREAPRPQRPEP